MVSLQGRALDPPDLWGRIVADIRLDPALHMSLRDFAGKITQRIGEPLDPSKVAASLKNLYATGRFEELRAEANQQAGEVILIFRGHPQFFVGLLRVTNAPRGIDPSTLVSATHLRLGQPISEDEREAARRRILALLADEAYYQARVSLEINRNQDTHEENVTFLVDAGRPARLARVQFQGAAEVPPARLVSVTRWKPGVHLTTNRLDRGLSRLHRFYVAHHRLEATSAVQKRQFDPRRNEETLVVSVTAGPEVRVRVRGARLSSSDLKRLLPVYRRGAIDELSLREGAHNIESYLQRKGYFEARATVQSSSHPAPPRVDITYTIKRGPHEEFAGYAFRGNHALPSSDLASVLSIQPADFPLQLHGIFDQDMLDHDVKAITALYQTRGFLDARVSAELNHQYENDPHRLFITFRVDEGPLTKVRHLTLEGLDPELATRLRSSLLTRPGQAYSPARARSDRDTILGYFADRGYTQATVSWSATPPTPSHEVDVEYRVAPGPKAEIQHVILMGNNHTRDDVIDRQLTFREREPLNESRLLESQQKLYNLGLFNQVQVATQNPNGAETQKTVLVGLEEAKRWTVGYGGGLDVQRLTGSQAQGQYSVSPRVVLELDRINVGGRPQTFSLHGHFSNLEKIGSTSYVIPDFLAHRDFTLRLEGLVDQSRNVLTFNAKRQEAGISVQKEYSQHSSVLAHYSFRRVEVSNLQIQPQAIPLFSQPVRVATLGGSYVNDHRDNPVDATRGSYSFVDAGIAWSRLGSQADFLRFSAQNSSYYSLRPYLIFARNTRLGVEGAYGCPSQFGSALTPCTVAAVPLPERFFMGGSESHRGFSLNQAGPRDPVTGFPIGGKALFLNQLELRFPLEENRLGLVLFNDAGNVFSTVHRMRLLKFTQDSPTDFDYDVEALGIGFRYQTPVGPLRFDIGYALNPPRFQELQNGLREALRLPRFQFLLSVGQSF
jgi:outer membrane protein insertion porin family